VLLFVVSVMNFLLHVIGDDKEKQTKQLARWLKLINYPHYFFI
jgi:hypothetical protein